MLRVVLSSTRTTTTATTATSLPTTKPPGATPKVALPEGRTNGTPDTNTAGNRGIGWGQAITTKVVTTRTNSCTIAIQHGKVLTKRTKTHTSVTAARSTGTASGMPMGKDTGTVDTVITVVMATVVMVTVTGLMGTGTENSGGLGMVLQPEVITGRGGMHSEEVTSSIQISPTP